MVRHKDIFYDLYIMNPLTCQQGFINGLFDEVWFEIELTVVTAPGDVGDTVVAEDCFSWSSHLGVVHSDGGVG